MTALSRTQENIPHQMPSIVGLLKITNEDDNPHMEQLMQKKLKDLIELRRLTPEAASKKAGLDRGYIQKLLDRPTASPRADTLLKLAHALEVDVGYFLDASHIKPWADVGPHPDNGLIIDSEVDFQFDGNTRPAHMHVPESHLMPKNIPVLGTAAGSHHKGAFQLTADPIDYVRRPPALINARDIYGLYVEGDSMYPQFPQGELIIINPHKPARPGDAVVVQCKNSEIDGTEATLGILRKRTEKQIMIGKHNPMAEIGIPSSSVIYMHKVLTVSELLGM